jgi:hypothetical protein
MYVSFECCVLSGRGRCDGSITHPEESYRVWCFSLSVIAKLRKVRLSPGIGLRRHGKEKNVKYRTEIRYV